MKRFAIAAVLAWSAVASSAQQPASESIEVRVVNVDVVVRDKAGKPVTGLTKDDFEIFENNKKQEITNLYEVRPSTSPAGVIATPQPSSAAVPAATEAPADTRRRNIVMFVDNYSLAPFQRDKILKSLQKFIDDSVRPQDQVMLVLCTQQTKVITPFTSDRKLLQQGIESIKQTASSGFNRQHSVEEVKRRVNEYIDAGKEGRRPWSDFYQMSLSLVESDTEEVIFASKNTLAALGQTTAALSGMEGKNVLIFAGAHLPEHPGVEMYQWLYNAFLPYMRSVSITSESILGKSGSMQHYSIEEAAKTASVSGVALYIIDAADSRDTSSAERSSATDQTEQFLTFTNTAMAYQTLARISGGLALMNSENFDLVFKTLADDLNSYYSLGFKPSNGADGVRHNLVVKTKNAQYNVRTRETYATKSTEDEMSARVIANINNSDPRGTWKIELHPGTPEQQGNEYRVPIEISIAPTITLLPQNADLAGGFTVYIVVGSGGRTSKVIKSPHPVKIPAEVEDEFRMTPMTYKAVILMTRGENILSAGILDQTSNNSGFARATVMIP
jgi:VWFA-related protein